MQKVKYTYWRDGQFYLGFLNDYPDYQTQGFSKNELIANLKELLKDIESGEIPFLKAIGRRAVEGAGAILARTRLHRQHHRKHAPTRRSRRSPPSPARRGPPPWPAPAPAPAPPRPNRGRVRR